MTTYDSASRPISFEARLHIYPQSVSRDHKRRYIPNINGHAIHQLRYTRGKQEAPLDPNVSYDPELGACSAPPSRHESSVGGYSAKSIQQQTSRPPRHYHTDNVMKESTSSWCSVLAAGSLQASLRWSETSVALRRIPSRDRSPSK